MVEKPKMLCDVFRESTPSVRKNIERGDMGYATYSRWERCITYLEEFMALTRGEKGYSRERCDTRFHSGFRAFP